MALDKPVVKSKIGDVVLFCLELTPRLILRPFIVTEVYADSTSVSGTLFYRDESDRTSEWCRRFAKVLPIPGVVFSCWIDVAHFGPGMGEWRPR